jgi:hypothetical protein
MDYDWQEIFKEKTNKELYDIYCGRSGLPVSAVEFAKIELEKRNFNFENIEDLAYEQKFNSLAEEATKINLFLQNNPNSSLKFKLIMSIIAVVPLFLFFGLNDVPLIIPIIISAFAIPATLISTAITDRIRRKKISRLEILEKELRTLIDQQNQSVTNTEKKLSISEFDNTVKTKVLSSLKFNRNVAYIVAIILLAIMLIKFFLK